MHNTEGEGLGYLVTCMVCARWKILNIWSKDWRPECSKGSINQYSLLLDRLRLISTKFIRFYRSGTTPHVSTLCLLDIVTHDKIFQIFPLHLCISKTGAGEILGTLSSVLELAHSQATWEWGWIGIITDVCLFVCLLFKVSSGLCHQYLINLILEAFIPRKGS